MTLSAIGDWLADREGFDRLFTPLLVQDACRDLGPQFSLSAEYANVTHDWDYLLLAASALTASSDRQTRLMALRIAQACLLDDSADDTNKDSAAVVLDALGNYLAVELAQYRGHIPYDVAARLPLAARLEWIRRSFTNSISPEAAGTPRLRVNPFQKQLWGALQASSRLSVSAPTSAGKSYLMMRWVVDYLREFPGSTLVYVVPTRALISQVERDLATLISQVSDANVNVATVPIPASLEEGMSNVLVFTQERLHILLTVLPQLRVSVLVVDEAQKIGDGARGVLLQEVIERVERDHGVEKVVFASPMSSNPGLLVENEPEASSFRSDEAAVTQSLIWLTQVPRKPREWTVEICEPKRVLTAGTLFLNETPGSAGGARLAQIANAVGANQPGNIVYVSRPSDAEAVAVQLASLAETAGGAADELQELADLVATVIHPNYLLVETLKRGIAFHYGNMPLIVRSEVERLFSLGVVKYLVCTSTLIEGVNLACRNVFLRGPKKGVSQPMSPDDFWNLAGRAGRWGKDFQGNVFCVDARNEQVWKTTGPPQSRVLSPISRTVDNVLRDPVALAAFTVDPEAAERGSREALASVVSYAAVSSVRDRAAFQEHLAREAGTRADSVVTALDALVGQLTIPMEIVERNPGLDPRQIQALLRYFEQRDGDLEELLPTDPASDDALDALIRIFGRCNKTISPSWGPDGRSFYLALLVHRWMNGWPLSRLIADRIKSNSSRARPMKLPGLIRLVMAEVEQVARFEAPRALGCYRDVLVYFLGQRGRQDLAREVFDYTVLLEFGVSQTTQLSLISLGLSRTSAILLSERIAMSDLTEAESVEWIRTNDALWRGSGLPVLIVREIDELIALRTP